MMKTNTPRMTGVITRGKDTSLGVVTPVSFKVFDSSGNDAVSMVTDFVMEDDVSIATIKVALVSNILEGETTEVIELVTVSLVPDGCTLESIVVSVAKRSNDVTFDVETVWFPSDAILN